MSRWGDAATVIELLDRQFEYLADLAGTTKLIRLARVIEFLVQEPLVAAVLHELRIEAQDILDALDRLDSALRGKAKQVCEQAPPPGLPDDWHQRVDDVPPFDFEADFGAKHQRHQATERLLVELGGESDGELAAASASQLRFRACERLRAYHEHQAKQLELGVRSSAWPAFERLVQFATAVNPVPPRERSAEAWSVHHENRRFAEALETADFGDVDITDDVSMNDLYAQLEKDARLVHEEIRFRLRVQRSRLTLVQRYAARCEAFDADRLRERCEASPSRAERLLTLDLARYLFDAGLRPLLDAGLGGLRPDLLHVEHGTLFYVEAKQYSEDHPSSRLKAAYKQVWGTWARLRNDYRVPEAFLVIFRRGGPSIDVPHVIRHDGLRLYTVVADISEEGGSKERARPLKLSEDELGPEAE